MSEQSYWAQGRPFDVQRRAIEHSALVVGAYTMAGEQVGFARMVTDLATWAWLCDVYVMPEHRGGGLGTVMVRTIVEHPDVVDVRWQFLATRDAHELYAKFGFRALDDPARWMQRG
jgi:GNAT superfamily N-acetyltransferase